MTNCFWKDILFQTELVGNSPEMNHIRKSVSLASQSKYNAIILGDPGTEKILIAKMIYAKGQQIADSFLIADATRLNIAFEDEMQNGLSPGQANETIDIPRKCIIVIQNLEHLTSEAQHRLLKISKHGHYRLNPKDNKETQLTPFRLLCTSTPKIYDEVQNGRFDGDLFLLLSEMTIKLPPLSERKQDIPILVEHFLQRICAELGRPMPAINFEIFNQMLKHSWPGNLKELENVVRNLVLSSPENELLPELLPFFKADQQFGNLQLQPLSAAVAQLEKELIQKALRRFAGNQCRAAQALGLSEPNMRFKMKKLGIRKDDFLLGLE